MRRALLLVPGRTSRQGVAANLGKDTAEYREATETVEVCAEDLEAIGCRDGDRVRVTSAHGCVVLVARARPPADLPPGLAFVAYGTPSSRLMGGETHGTGMPDSKGIPVWLEPAAR